MAADLKAHIREAVDTLKSGGTLLYPTDTVWGIGCDATNSDAVRKVAALKDRAASKSYVCLVANDGMLQRYVPDIPDVAWELIMTGAAISTIPTLIVFLIFQRFIIRGVVMAGLKG